MGSHLVTLGHDIPRKRRVRFSDSSQDKEGSPCIRLIENLQQRMGVGNHAISDREGMIERGLRPVFDIHSQ